MACFNTLQSYTHSLFQQLLWLPVEYRSTVFSRITISFKIANITFNTLHYPQLTECIFTLEYLDIIFTLLRVP